MSKILVVEDDIASQMLMTDILEKYGYTAVVATDGLEAISLAEMCIRDSAYTQQSHLPSRAQR